VFDNLKADNPKNWFTISIIDDVTFTSLPRARISMLPQKGQFSASSSVLGSDGTVGANKQLWKLSVAMRICILRLTFI